MPTWSCQKFLADRQHDKQLFLKFNTLPGTTTADTHGMQSLLECMHSQLTLQNVHQAGPLPTRHLRKVHQPIPSHNLPAEGIPRRLSDLNQASGY